MPLVARRLPQHVANVRDAAAALVPATVETVNAAAAAAGGEAVSYTADKYNLDPDVLKQYVYVTEANPQARPKALITLRVKAIPLEAFDPQIVMKQFTFTDSRGRHISRLLPAVYFTRFRDGGAKYLRPAFPLRTRSSGSLLPGDVIRRRIGADRRKLTKIRFYTFPTSYLKGDLVPHLQGLIGTIAGVTFKASWRRFSKRGTELRNGSGGLK